MKRIYLLGFMGSGKSSVGRKLAEAMEWSFVDMDEYIEERIGRSISQIFEEDGEDCFRLAETACLNELSKKSKVVIGTGGGCPCFQDNMEVIKSSGCSIFLDVEPSIIAQRLYKEKDHRPLVASLQDGELELFVTNLLHERRPFYLQSDLVIDASQDIMKVSDSILLWVRKMESLSESNNCGKDEG